MARVRLEVPHTLITVALPTTHVRALAAVKKRAGGTRSALIRRLVAVELKRQAEIDPKVREILHG